jgi:hypothetical protein
MPRNKNQRKKSKIRQQQQQQQKIRQSEVVKSKEIITKDLFFNDYATLVKYRTILEFAILSLISDDDVTTSPPLSRSKSATKMANSQRGWDRLVNPVQDLGRSLMNFLVGSGGGQRVSPRPPAEECEATTNSGGRSRPQGHNASAQSGIC